MCRSHIGLEWHFHFFGSCWVWTTVFHKVLMLVVPAEVDSPTSSCPSLDVVAVLTCLCLKVTPWVLPGDAIKSVEFWLLLKSVQHASASCPSQSSMIRPAKVFNAGFWGCLLASYTNHFADVIYRMLQDTSPQAIDIRGTAYSLMKLTDGDTADTCCMSCFLPR